MSAGPQIVVWANEDLPPWQRDAVRRLLTSHKLTDEDRKELLTMAKVAGEKIGDGDLVLVRPGTAGRLRSGTDVVFASATAGPERGIRLASHRSRDPFLPGPIELDKSNLTI